MEPVGRVVAQPNFEIVALPPGGADCARVGHLRGAAGSGPRRPLCPDAPIVRRCVSGRGGHRTRSPSDWRR